MFRSNITCLINVLPWAATLLWENHSLLLTDPLRFDSDYLKLITQRKGEVIEKILELLFAVNSEKKKSYLVEKYHL